eukprot:2953279-Amphidinium_carterae.1
MLHCSTYSPLRGCFSKRWSNSRFLCDCEVWSQHLKTAWFSYDGSVFWRVVFGTLSNYGSSAYRSGIGRRSNNKLWKDNFFFVLNVKDSFFQMSATVVLP